MGGEMEMGTDKIFFYYERGVPSALAVAKRIRRQKTEMGTDKI